jgi:hypothetical protein
VEWQTILSILASACAIVFGYLAFVRNKKNDDANEGKKDGVVLTELGYIKSGVDDIKRKQEKQDEHNTKFEGRLSKVETSAAQAHKRIDTVEKHIEHYHMEE